ncbi:50S ribosomal protein L21 [Tuwongella immobilis]|uniref:Large ribosomal subunit protein bL21 n=1 Tax=Tuwongella immobilis TaxID=692036 RepID=A0A6C2YUR7_9BACT|nr:50S ribosomal protein L21 [Tuwongella immobilis]VIP05246.1 50s ribosomal protein l21 : 50S ribosomal protein L21 OS=Sutterella wadsworthensis 2_1_59BFAA GN=rplU PE=3 SV=1: Ribosomal_L21p [Tuwongella immobilis]VTS07848.1 50s ribosomal protein l21 : 50S ribosomal protein L21 OS=Sutterella wadsworthensis 2_1_59BFAA GN=rplU PE=3 SV=1: Ribosomal_L21p [Tuwongella immobilis]
MYAIFEDGSRQYRVSVGDRVKIDHRSVDLNGTVELSNVLLVAKDSGLEIGKPTVEGARVIGTVINQPGIKQTIQHYRRRKASKRLKGHTQPYVELRVEHILLKGETTPAKAAPTTEATPTA